METKYQNLYNEFLSIGELDKVFPDSSGNWEKDKKKFIELQEDLEKKLESKWNIETIYEEETED